MKEDIKDLCNKLEDLFEEKIRELHESKGGISARHAYCYYRELVWQIRSSLNAKIKSK